MLAKRYLPLLALFLLVELMPSGAWAYGTDVHFNLTYVLCRLAGLEAKDALWIAAADQSMDDNKYTTAFSDVGDATWQSLPFTDKVWPRNGRDFHAFSDVDATETIDPRGIPVTIHYSSPSAARQAIRKRMGDLFQRLQKITIAPSNEDTIITSEIAMGQFLHFEQDYFAHRQMTPDCTDEQKWLPYGTFWGHFKDGHHPDYVAERPKLALLMIQDTYKCIRDYTATVPNHKAPTVLSQENMTTLITDLAKAYPYHVERLNTGTMTGKLGDQTPNDIQTKVFDDIPNQLAADKALITALGQIKHTTAMGELPKYSNDYTLPYDKPQTPLSTVKSKFDDYSP